MPHEHHAREVQFRFVPFERAVRLKHRQRRAPQPDRSGTIASTEPVWGFQNLKAAPFGPGRG